MRPNMQKYITNWQRLYRNDNQLNTVTKLRHNGGQGWSEAHWIVRVHASCIQMFHAIVNTDNMYITKREDLEFEERIWYDVTEYERTMCCSQSRWNKSPLALLAYCDNQVIESKESTDILRGDLLQKWASSKMRSNLFFIIIWAFLRIVCVFLFYCLTTLNLTQFHLTFISLFSNGSDTLLVTNVYPNQTCQPHNSWYYGFDYKQYPNMFDAAHRKSFWTISVAAGYVLLYNTLSMTFDITRKIIMICRNSNKWRSFQGKRKCLIIGTWYYRTSQFIFSLFSTMYILLLALEILGSFEIPGVKILLIISCLTSAPPVLYFLQICPSIGHLIIGIQRMLTIMATFIGLYNIVLQPFPHAFLVLLKDNNDCQVKGFETYIHGIYSSFKVMLNMLDFSDYESTGEYLFMPIVILCKSLHNDW